ncbi:MAG: hypothetical protein HPY83_08055 [Anaerolineae bacterium]|nr:hypothetical protein [Anaerolineae bacterium]
MGTCATLSVLDVDSGQAILVSNQVSYWARDPFAWSPEGDRIMYAIAAKEGHTPELWMDADGRDPVLILDGGEDLGIYDELVWLPVTSEVVFAHIGTGPYASAVCQATNETSAVPVELVRGAESLQVTAGGDRTAWTQVDPRDPVNAQTFFAALSR